jgi:hypothetical protein
MRIAVQTLRYGIDTWLEFHGKSYSFDPINLILEIDEPVMDEEDGIGRIGMSEIIMMTPGDRIIVELCGAKCSLHPITGDAVRKKVLS